MTQLEATLLEALRALGNQATLGDLSQRASLATAEVEGHILGALAHVGGHVAVDEHGQLVYSIARSRPLPRFTPSWPARVWAALYGAFRVGFFAALSVALVLYFVVYIVLIIAVIVAGIAAASKGGDCDCDCDCKCPDCGKCDCDGCGACCDGAACHGCNRPADTLYAKTVGRKRPELVAGRKALREVQAVTRSARAAARGERARARARRLANALAGLRGRSLRGLDLPLEVEVVSDKPPFFRAVRDFVFGPPRSRPSTEGEYGNLLGFVREHGGRITATDAAMLTGLPRDAADRLLLELAVRHGGDVEVSEDGVVLYTFERFVISAGADTDDLGWLERLPSSRVTVADFARARGVPASEALARLEVLAHLAGARVEHGATTTFVFDEGARANLASAGTEHRGLRDYRYAWERLEKAPAILGVPAGSRGWIWGLNSFNLALSIVLLAIDSDGARVVGELFGFMSPTLELWALGWAPFLLSAGVFVIPFVRLIIEAIRNGGRKARNARRVVLLGLAHQLQSGPVVTRNDLRQALELGPDANEALDRLLTKLGVELEADLDERGELRFGVAWREVSAIARHADALDPAAFGLKAFVYDTSKPM